MSVYEIPRDEPSADEILNNEYMKREYEKEYAAYVNELYKEHVDEEYAKYMDELRREFPGLMKKYGLKGKVLFYENGVELPDLDFFEAGDLANGYPVEYAAYENHDFYGKISPIPGFSHESYRGYLTKHGDTNKNDFVCDIWYVLDESVDDELVDDEEWEPKFKLFKYVGPPPCSLDQCEKNIREYMKSKERNDERYD